MKKTSLILFLLFLLVLNKAFAANCPNCVGELTINQVISNFYFCGQCPSKLTTEEWCSTCPYYDLHTTNKAHLISYSVPTYCSYCQEINGTKIIYICGESRTTFNDHNCSK
jgi:hypothetical protein